MSHDEERITVPFEYDIGKPKKERAYIVPEHIFKRIKNRFSNKKLMVPSCQNIGSCSLGVAGSALITAFSADKPNLFYLFIFVLFLIVGIVLWIFSIVISNIEDSSNIDLINDLSLIEQTEIQMTENTKR